MTKRLIVGKPGFEAPKRDDTWDDDAPTTDYAEDREAKRQQVADTDLFDDGGNKVIPVVGVIRVKYDISGPAMDVWATIHNHSTRSLMLDKITLLGQRVELNYRLEAGAQREFRVFRGPRPTHDSYKKAELYYKDVVTGDYFRADHMVDYHFDSTDHSYGVEGLTLLMPIHDV